MEMMEKRYNKVPKVSDWKGFPDLSLTVLTFSRLFHNLCFFVLKCFLVQNTRESNSKEEVPKEGSDHWTPQIQRATQNLTQNFQRLLYVINFREFYFLKSAQKKHIFDLNVKFYFQLIKPTHFNIKSVYTHTISGEGLSAKYSVNTVCT